MVFAFGEFLLDTSAFELTHRGRVVSLSRRPLDLLTYLVVHRDRVVMKRELLSAVWEGVSVTDNALAQAVAVVRSTLAPCGPEVIRSVRCRGYRFVVPVEELSEAHRRRSERRSASPETLRISAHASAPLGTFRTLLAAYANARPDALVDGVPLTRAIARATTSAEIVALMLALVSDPMQAPAALVVEHLERADLESLLLYAALAARPEGTIVVRGTCAWGRLPPGSPVARLLPRGLAGAPEFAA